MKTLSIGITTFRNRLPEVTSQINAIRYYNKTIPIILAITTNHGEIMPEDYRKSILLVCASQPNIYPLMFPGYTGLAKMWNNIMIHARTTHVFMMNDDITFANPMAINEINMHIQTKEVFLLNSTFGTFVISKKLLSEIGYFDERLIAYGEEDGDFMDRYHAIYGNRIERIPMQSVQNRVQNRQKTSYDSSMDCMIGDGGFKPIVNVEIIKKKKIEKWPNLNQYPYEKFIEDNYNNIAKYKEVIYEDNSNKSK